MSDPGQPSGGDDVQSALRTIIDSYGVSALSNEGALSNLLSDLLADNPREAGLLLLAAKADVAGGLGQRVQQGMDPATAVRMTASAMAESSPAAPEACTWVTTEVARALGHPVSAVGSLAPSSQPTVAAPGDPGGQVATDAPTVASSHGGAPGSWPPPGGGGQPAAAWGQPGGAWGPEPSNPPSGPWGPPSGPPPSNPPSGPWSPQPTSAPPQPGFGGPPLNGQPPGGPPPPPKKGGRGKVFAAVGAVVGVVIVYIIVAAAAKIAPFSSSSPTTSTTPPTTPAPTPTGPSTGVAQATLAQLMPDSNQINPTNGYDVSSCNNDVPYSNLQLKGLTNNLNCGDIPGYANWVIYGYKFDTDADYTAGLAAYNQASNYDPQTAAGNNCPPPSTGAKGISPYHTSAYPSRPGNSQAIECLQTLNGQNQQVATYIYTLPTQRAFFEVDAAPGVPFATLDQWWDQNGGPGTAPSS